MNSMQIFELCIEGLSLLLGEVGEVFEEGVSDGLDGESDFLEAGEDGLLDGEGVDHLPKYTILATLATSLAYDPSSMHLIDR